MISTKKKITNPIIIEGFPGFGLVGTITTEWLMQHLKMELIGSLNFDDMPPMVAVHGGKVVQPIGIYYNAQHNLILVHVLTNVKGMEWKVSKLIMDLANEFKAKEIISLEGIGATQPSDDPAVYYFSNDKERKGKLTDIGLPPLNEGIIMGATASVMLEAKNLPLTCLFAEVHTELPDSKAAAKIIEALDKYMGLKVDYEGLYKQAEVMEAKLKGIMSQSAQAEKAANEKAMSYVG